MNYAAPISRSNAPPLFGALDLGTNSCRMLIAQPQDQDFKVLDAFSKTVYLGRGLDKSGRLNRAAQERTISALSVCASKLKRLKVEHSTLVATAACRLARNGRDFIELAKKNYNPAIVACCKCLVVDAQVTSFVFHREIALLIGCCGANDCNING